MFTGQIGEFITAILNTNVHTFSVSPVLALIETKVIKEMARIAGLDPRTADGIVVPGGSYANLIAFYVARHRKFPHVRQEGWRATDRPVVFTSAQTHYSVSRSAMMGGMGMQNCIAVKANLRGVLDVEDLERCIQKAIAEGKTPFFVNANCGSTVMGGMDPFEAMAVVCKKYDIWLHIDACWGGHAFFSPIYKDVLKGAELCDSISLDPHKGLGAPIQMSMIITNNRLGLLQEANGNHLLMSSAPTACHVLPHP